MNTLQNSREKRHYNSSHPTSQWLMSKVLEVQFKAKLPDPEAVSEMTGRNSACAQRYSLWLLELNPDMEVYLGLKNGMGKWGESLDFRATTIPSQLPCLPSAIPCIRNCRLTISRSIREKGSYLS